MDGGKGKGPSGMPAVRSVQDPPRASQQTGKAEVVERNDGVGEATTRHAATQTYEAATSATRPPPPAAVATHAQSTTTTTVGWTTSPILHHQLAHLHAEFSSLQHAFFALQAGNVSLHNYVLDQQIRNQNQLHELRAENQTLEIGNKKKDEGLVGEIVQLREENARLRGFVQWMRVEAGDLLAMERRDGEGDGGAGEDSGIGGEV